jgi:hypothetical protein
VRCLVHLHSCDLVVQLGSLRVNLSEHFVTLFGDLGEYLGALLGDLRKTLGALLLRLLQHATDSGKHYLHCRLQ